MIRVCLVDDQTLVRQGIRSLLELTRDIEVVGEAEDGMVALERIRVLQPDVVLLDLQMPRLDGLGVLKALQGSASAPPVLILMTFDDDVLVLEGLRMGAKGYLFKDVSLEQLVMAVRTLHERRTLVQPAVTERILRSLTTVKGNYPSFEVPERLTEREREILRLMAGGYSNKEISAALEVSEGTSRITSRASCRRWGCVTGPERC